jgi:GTP-binding protein EngB required for normal cell division
MWRFATCWRAPRDHLLQLAITGISSVGKSTLVENIMLEGGHNMTSEEYFNSFYRYIVDAVSAATIA